MQLHSLMFVAMIALAGAATAAETIAWGTPNDGLRVGLAASSTPGEPTLRILFENIGPGDQTLLIGRSTGLGPMYNLEFTATSPAGKKVQVFNGGPGVVGGYMSPLAVHLRHGEASEVSIPMHKMAAVFNRVDRLLDALLRDGYSVQASLAVEEGEIAWSVSSEKGYAFRKMWMGTMLSGDYRQPR